MAYPQHWLLQFGGPLGASDEIWTNSIRFAREDGGGPTTITIPGVLDDMVEVLQDWWSDANANYTFSRSPAQLEFVKFNEIGPDGKYEDPNTTYEEWFSPQPSGRVTGPEYPYQVTQAVTWLTNNSRGLASKGRIFIPLPSLPMNQNSGVIQNNVELMVDSYVRLIQDLNGCIPLAANAVQAAVVSSVGTPGPASHIRAVRIGNVLDTQRRRRNQLVEQYYDADI